MVLLTQLARAPVLIWYLVRLPRAYVRLSDHPAGTMITEGVLYLPSDSCGMLLTNSYDAPLLPPGQRHCRRPIGG